MEQHYSSTVSDLEARLLTPDPERRPSAREILERLSVPEEDHFFTARTHVDTNLLVTSSGPTAEYCGNMLGLYKKAGTHNNCPYYKQMDIEKTDNKEHVIYRHTELGWAMGPGLDGFCCLKNASKTESVPLTGWSCLVMDGRFKEDFHLSISSDHPPTCEYITITASGDAAVRHSTSVGVYTPTQIFSCGRQVFKHQTQERYLRVPQDNVLWYVQDSAGGFIIGSSCAPSMCPADPRARTSERYRVTSWSNWGGADWRYGQITVKCSIHK